MSAPPPGPQIRRIQRPEIVPVGLLVLRFVSAIPAFEWVRVLPPLPTLLTSFDKQAILCAPLLADVVELVDTQDLKS